MAASGEFDLIDRYCKKIGLQHAATQITVGDDAAAIRVEQGYELLVSVDTMVAGVHFLDDASPASLAHKLLHVNASDIVAMGGAPKWATLALTLPEFDKAWLDSFSVALHQQATALGVQLIGGDTTKGPLSLSLQILGIVKQGQAVKRAGAKLGDDVYVSGYLGHAALGLLLKQAHVSLDNDADAVIFIEALEKPQAQLTLVPLIASFANACIDISDGLLADTGHIAKSSGVDIEIELSSLPLSSSYLKAADKLSLDLALSGGDDYQLCFTCPVSARQAIAAEAQQLGAMLTRIGRVTGDKSTGVVALLKNGESVPTANVVDRKGYNHFTE